jgi:integrase
MARMARIQEGAGYASNSLEVDDKTIQEILRHSSITITQEIYIKTVSADSAAATETLEAALERRIH